MPKYNDVEVNFLAAAEVEEKTIDDYKRLDEKCDIVISKIKNRKKKSIKK
jgi:hypothetical protein